MSFLSRLNSLIVVSLLSFTVISCRKIDLYEKTVAIPDQQWSSAFKPSFSFRITDSAAYNVYIVIRHNEKYEFNNIWVNLATRLPGDTALKKVQYELPLANSEGWLVPNAMDDLYEHRIAITPAGENFYFRPGDYTFTMEQIMREDPLLNVLNVGLRIERKTNQ